MVIVLIVEKRLSMPAKSEAQAISAAMALRAKRGEIPFSSLGPVARQMFTSMSREQLLELAETPRKGLPKKVKKSSHDNR